jgi:hypothetical protein
MMKMYHGHNKKKIEQIPQIIAEWKGKELELLSAVRSKYCRYSRSPLCLECRAHSKIGFGKMQKFK